MNYLPAVAVIGLHRGSLIKIGKPKGIWASCVTRTGTAGRTRPVTRNGTPAQADNRFADNNSTIHPGTDSHDAFHTAGTCGDWVGIKRLELRRLLIGKDLGDLRIEINAYLHVK